MDRKRPHPTLLIVCLLGISALFAGCETLARFDHRAPRVEPKQIAMYRTNTKPPAKVKDIGVLTDEGTLREQGQIEGKFIQKARGAGADALVFEPVVKIGEETRFFALVDTYAFKATMICYEK